MFWFVSWTISPKNKPQNENILSENEIILTEKEEVTVTSISSVTVICVSVTTKSNSVSVNLLC